MPFQSVSNHGVHRAIAAFHRRCIREGAIYQRPAEPESFVDSATLDRYIVLRNIRGVLAMYRERGDRRSMRCIEQRAWPKELIDA